MRSHDRKRLASSFDRSDLLGNVQSIETLPNGFAIKNTVKGFQSSKGNSYQNVGLKPDVEVSLSKDIQPRELRIKYDISKRLELDPQLKAAT